ncbi:hypothetical protein YC2023_117947 [Brassica napus]
MIFVTNPISFSPRLAKPKTILPQFPKGGEGGDLEPLFYYHRVQPLDSVCIDDEFQFFNHTNTFRFKKQAKGRVVIRIKITDSNHDHDKSSRSSNSGNGHSNISDDESHKFIGKILIIKLVLFKRQNVVFGLKTLFPRNFLGLFRGNSEETLFFLGISSEYSEEIPKN